MVKFEELEVGQTVKHRSGFTGEVVEIIDSNNVAIKITDKGTGGYEVGYRYTAMPEYIEEIVKPAPNKQKLTIEVETVGMEKAVELGKEMLLLADDMADIRKEESVFKAELGNGLTFEGTKSDFKVFMEGVTEMFAVAKNMGL